MATQKPVAEKWLKADRLRAVGRLRPVGDLADADLQPAPTPTEFSGSIGIPVPST